MMRSFGLLEDGRSIEAHRGYIKSVAAQGQAGELLALYTKLLAGYPDDPVLLYAAGLTETYLPGRERLAEADKRSDAVPLQHVHQVSGNGLEAFQNALRLAPDFPEALLQGAPLRA
jgi:hypothetical protein